MSMDERVTRLEVEFEHVRKDLDEIRTDQKHILKALGTLEATLGQLRGDFRTEIAKRPTTGQFWSILAVVAGLAFTTVLLILGGISVALQYIGP